MFGSLMHNILGSGPFIGSNMAQSVLGPSSGLQNTILRAEPTSKSRKIFHGTVEVLQVSNGYVINIGRKEGYEYETFIAETVTEVNERITATIVAFQLENK